MNKTELQYQAEPLASVRRCSSRSAGMLGVKPPQIGYRWPISKTGHRYYSLGKPLYYLWNKHKAPIKVIFLVPWINGVDLLGEFFYVFWISGGVTRPLYKDTYNYLTMDIQLVCCVIKLRGAGVSSHVWRRLPIWMIFIQGIFAIMETHIPVWFGGFLIHFSANTLWYFILTERFSAMRILMAASFIRSGVYTGDNEGVLMHSLLARSVNIPLYDISSVVQGAPNLLRSPQYGKLSSSFTTRGIVWFLRLSKWEGWAGAVSINLTKILYFLPYCIGILLYYSIRAYDGWLGVHGSWVDGHWWQ